MMIGGEDEYHCFLCIPLRAGDWDDNTEYSGILWYNRVYELSGDWWRQVDVLNYFGWKAVYDAVDL
ncbi:MULTISPECIES: hypothetical protein [Paenibacillus]|uniref:Uncharacterized protein n=1 Tax=Paenibacillus pabuli TaxID=1472 RepID=A0A855YHS7_9BACL|nr:MULTISPECIES: hypothetical protein [Paenibacillus]PWW45310.1 hypothetical protein DET56_101517 [Paenibacillus pabuli]PXW11647.1 hypothetical protein DEU73_101516 [Paenibacillus taichungensis]RAI84759.1 hypothetical protein DET54_12440 [Paenibacillus pabuli]